MNNSAAWSASAGLIVDMFVVLLTFLSTCPNKEVLLGLIVKINWANLLILLICYQNYDRSMEV